MSVALWCVLVAGVLPVFTVAIAKSGGLDNKAPRDWAGSLDGFRRRAHAAHLNHFEAFPLFAAAVLVATTQAGPSATLDALAAGFIVARLAYTACYVADLATLRSIVWTAGWGLTIAIFTLPALG